MEGPKDISQSQTNNQEDNFNDLVSMGFDPTLVTRALQLTNDKERAIELVLKFQDEPEGTISSTQPQEVVQTNKTEEQKVQEGLKKDKGSVVMSVTN